MTVKELFGFVTDLSITEDNIEEYLEKAKEIAANRTTEEVTEQEKIDEEVNKGRGEIERKRKGGREREKKSQNNIIGKNRGKSR